MIYLRKQKEARLRHIIVGDMHGNFKMLREFLVHRKLIDEDGNPINRDYLRLYSIGDLVDGHYNRDGDLLMLEWADKWFDKICIGNHEYAFLGGPNFGGARTRDREILRSLVSLEAKGKYVPSFVLDNFLIVHGGLAERWGFNTAQDASDAINFAWQLADSENDRSALLDWIGPERAGKWADDTGGIFWLDWSEKRNRKINQIVGHTTSPDGPLVKNYGDIEHWNIDAGGKTSHCVSGVEIENGFVIPFYYGNRWRWAVDDKEDQDDDENLSRLKELMEEN